MAAGRDQVWYRDSDGEARVVDDVREREDLRQSAHARGLLIGRRAEDMWAGGMCDE